MRWLMQKLSVLAHDFCYGIHAANAIQHGLPAPDGARRDRDLPPASTSVRPAGDLRAPV